MKLSIDRLKEKYLSKTSHENGKENFENYLKTINRQIKDSDFFDILKKNQPKKYRIAIRKFTVGVNQYHDARKKK